MHSSFYMIEKELIEHKMVTRVPLFVLVCGGLLFISLIMNNGSLDNFSYQVEVSGDMDIMPLDLGKNINWALTSIIGILSMALTSLYLPRTLRKERQDGTSMFWRSMPVSYSLTHAVKLGFGLLVIPLICSLLILIANAALWLANITSGDSSLLFSHQSSLAVVMTNWFMFIIKTWEVSVALLPLACIALMLSQLVTSPILTMVLIGYAAKWLSVGLFGYQGVSEFLSTVLSLPYQTLTTGLFTSFSQASIMHVIIYFALGACALVASISLYKTASPSWKSLFDR
ncbi:hypothetical protein BCU68_02995 [Vibrio sp. 10N.286.49.B3]|uniref:hypothetical protein n=1 Tax=Vibrio sp. 10N.286.49.B3 TaxID=1880855 RepID=UPI000C8631E9|nr:hypothetical protein [Vibrio sp. 10N.286.49.B3]PMH44484.1 hypothetical protein BCU68_02995 [Vibrio sp. 10N.286.49.B3]